MLLQELRERVLRGKYRIPFYMSTDCENLLKKFLILNPSKRGTLEVSSPEAAGWWSGGSHRNPQAECLPPLPFSPPFAPSKS